eukprot:740545-Pleurochrysis_carterae.AAC.3
MSSALSGAIGLRLLYYSCWRLSAQCITYFIPNHGPCGAARSGAARCQKGPRPTFSGSDAGTVSFGVACVDGLKSSAMIAERRSAVCR